MQHDLWHLMLLKSRIIRTAFIQCLLGTALWTLFAQLLISLKPCKIGIITPILRVQKLNFSEVKKIISDHRIRTKFQAFLFPSGYTAKQNDPSLIILTTCMLSEFQMMGLEFSNVMLCFKTIMTTLYLRRYYFPRNEHKMSKFLIG